MRHAISTILVLLAGCSNASAPEGGPPTEEVDELDPQDGMELRMEATIEPGQEITYCQYFRTPDDRAVDIGRFTHDYTPGSHHLLLIRVDPSEPPPTEMFACGTGEVATLEDRPQGIVYGAQTPEGDATFPDGVAMELTAGSTLLMQSHYLNTSDEAVDAAVTARLWFVDPASVVHHAGTLFFFDPFIYIPAGEEASTTMRCPLPAGTKLLSAGSHMHRHGTGFDASLLDGPRHVYSTTSWADPDPASFFEDPMTVEQDAELEFTCRYRNDDEVAVAVGASAETDEMCIFAGVYYPVADRAIESCAGGSYVSSGTASCGETLGCAQGCAADTACLAACTTNVCSASSPALTSALMCLIGNCAGEDASCALEQCGAELGECSSAGC